jgi:hypothetical protein
MAAKYNLTSFSQQFPDSPFDTTQVERAFNNFINGTGPISAVVAFHTNISTQIAALQNYQSNLIGSTPEYKDQSVSPLFLSTISTVTSQTSTLQTQLSIVNTNVQNMQLKAGGNMTAFTFYVYTTVTIVIGILCIVLITYLVYMYMEPSSTIQTSSMKGGKRTPV